MRRGWVVAVAVVSLFLVWIAGLTLLSEQVPVWVRPWITAAGMGVLVLVGYLVARIWKPSADPPRAPRTPDPEVRPAIPDGRRLLRGHLAFCLAAAVLLSVVVTLGSDWVTSPAEAASKAGPTWYRVTGVLALCVVLTVGATSGVIQTSLLRAALAQAEAGDLAQWTGTVSSVRGSTVVLALVRIDGSDEHRLAYFKEPGLPADPLRPGDVVSLQGSPRRGGWVVMTDGSTTRWQSLSMLRPGPRGSYV